MPAIVAAGAIAAFSAGIPILIQGGFAALFTSSALSTIITAGIGGAISAAVSGGGGSGNSPSPTLLVRQGVQNGQFVYGRCRVSRAGVTFADNSGGDVWIVVPVACHEISKFVALHDGDAEMWTDAGGVASDYAGRIEVYTRTGADAQTHVPELIAAIASLDSNFRGRGNAYVVLRLIGFASNWENQAPQLWIDLEGALVYDPRLVATGYSANWALCVNHYLTTTRGGPGWTAIDQTALIVAANLSDEWVGDNGSFFGETPHIWASQTVSDEVFHRRYEINGSFSSDSMPREILRAMEIYGAGSIIYSQGDIVILAGAYSAPVASYTKDNLIAVPTIGGNLKIEEQVHGVRGTFADPSANYQLSDFPEVAFDVTVPTGEAAHFLDVALDREIHPERATRLAVLVGRKFFSKLAIGLTLPATAMAHEAGDRINFDMAEIGISTTLEIQEIKINLDPERPGVVLEGIEDGVSFWDWDRTDAGAVPIASKSTLAKTRVVIPVASVSLADATLVETDGTVRPRIRATFPASLDDFVEDYFVYWRDKVSGRTLGSMRTAGALVADLEAGLVAGDEVTVTIVTLNGNGRRSRGNPSANLTVLADTTIPDAPIGWAGAPGFDSIALYGPASVEADFKAFVIYAATAGDTALFKVDEIAGTRYVRRVPSGDVYTRYKVTQIDTSGNESAATGFINVIPSPPGFADLSDHVREIVDAADGRAAQLLEDYGFESLQDMVSGYEQHEGQKLEIAFLQLQENDALASILIEAQARVDGDAASAALITALDARVGGNETNITAINNVAVDSNSAVASYVFNLNATVEGLDTDITTAEANIVALNNVAVDSSSALAVYTFNLNATVEGLDTDLTAAEASIVAINNVAVDSNSAIATYAFNLNATVEGLDTDMTAVEASIVAINNVAVDSNSAVASYVFSLNATVEGLDTDLTTAQASIVALNNVAVDSDSALATYTFNLNATVEGLDADLTTAEASIVAINNVAVDSNSALAAYTFNLNVTVGGLSSSVSTHSSAISDLEGNAAASYLLAVKAGTGGAFLEIVAADDPEGGPVSSVTLSADQINLDGYITGAHFSDTIASDNFSAGAAGWQIERDGSAEFNDLVVRNDMLEAGSTAVGDGAVTDGLITATSHTAFTTVQEVTLTTTGGKVLVLYDFVLDGSGGAYVKVLRGGTVARNEINTSPGVGSYAGPYSGQFTDSPAAGTHIYKVQVRKYGSSSGSVGITNRSLSVFEFKQA